MREDYSPDGEAWGYLPFDHARIARLSLGRGWPARASATTAGSFASRGALERGGSDPQGAPLRPDGKEGNHGEDVKELYWYVDATPTYVYARALYKYPQRPFPYDELRARAAGATRSEPEPELIDTGVFDDNRYFDVDVEYAKDDVDDVLVRITVTNRGPRPAPLVLLPQLWFRNTWSWSLEAPQPRMVARRVDAGTSRSSRHAGAPRDSFWLHVEGAAGAALHRERDELPSDSGACANSAPYVKDAFHEAIVNRRSRRA